MKSRTVTNGTGAENSGLGTLYLVGTPIGNLEDISLRALRILREVDLIACEDTRQTQKLLNHFQIQTRTTSYHEHNEIQKAPELVRRLEQGACIALVSDSGMPAISDPGFRLVQLAIERQIPVIPVPGPTALVAAVVASGLPAHAFQFLGFVPARRNLRRKFLQELEKYPATSVFFEAPHRITETLSDVLEILGDRPMVVAREITKVHEEFLRGCCSEILHSLRTRPRLLGEMTVLVAGGQQPHGSPPSSQSLQERVDQLMQEQQLTRMDALKVVAKERKISKSQAYREYQD
jgi:16S rRNA (cytidine1402-2'-O)-methyltransferase